MNKRVFAISFLALVASYSNPLSAEEPVFIRVGEGVLNYLFWDVYKATLETPSGEYRRGEHPIRFSIRYLKKLEAKQIAKATDEQWRRLGKAKNIEKWGLSLRSFWPDVRSGDVISLVSNRQGYGYFYYNDLLIGEVEDPEFSDEFVDIWLSPLTSTPQLRRALLGDE